MLFAHRENFFALFSKLFNVTLFSPIWGNKSKEFLTTSSKDSVCQPERRAGQTLKGWSAFLEAFTAALFLNLPEIEVRRRLQVVREKIK